MGSSKLQVLSTEFWVECELYTNFNYLLTKLNLTYTLSVSKIITDLLYHHVIIFNQGSATAIGQLVTTSTCKKDDSIRQRGFRLNTWKWSLTYSKENFKIQVYKEIYIYISVQIMAASLSSSFQSISCLNLNLSFWCWFHAKTAVQLTSCWCTFACRCPDPCWLHWIERNNRLLGQLLCRTRCLWDWDNASVRSLAEIALNMYWMYCCSVVSVKGNSQPLWEHCFNYSIWIQYGWQAYVTIVVGP